MQELIRKVERVETYSQWEAVDGTVFNNREECEKYEQSAKGVLRGRLSALIKGKYNAWNLMGGYDDHDVIAVEVPSEKDIDIILQNYWLDMPYLLCEDHRERREEVEKAVRQAYEERDILLFGINCEEELYLIDTRNNIVNRLNGLGKEGKQ